VPRKLCFFFFVRPHKPYNISLDWNLEQIPSRRWYSFGYPVCFQKFPLWRMRGTHRITYLQASHTSRFFKKADIPQSPLLKIYDALSSNPIEVAAFFFNFNCKFLSNPLNFSLTLVC
jgi:hypothetical protein